ncbi:MAG: TonB-dependent receptor [Acidobacteriota bacterium]|nr:TonB-dependent receptor [Acidobacteriota bacterium]
MTRWLTIFFLAGQLFACQLAAGQDPATAAPVTTAPVTKMPSATTPPPAATPVATIVGSVKSGGTPLPGVALVAANTLTGKKVFTTTRSDGSFRILIPARGRWVVRAELPAFAAETKEFVFTPETLGSTQRADFELVLASRKQDTADSVASAIASGGFQSLDLAANEARATLSDSGQGDAAAGAMPLGTQAGSAATESYSISGAAGRTEGFSFNPDELESRIAEARASGQLGGGPGGGGGFGGAGGFGGGGPIMIMGGGGGGGRRRGRFDINKIHGQLFYNYGSSGLDAAPYALLGAARDKPDYAQSRFGFSLGGPLKIPKLYDGGTKTMFFLNYAGQNASNPFDVFANVPTLAERNGDFSATVFRSGPFAGQNVQIFDPVTHMQFTNNTLPAIDPIAAGLLAFIPQPNLPDGFFPNYHQVTSTDTIANNVNFRLIHNFGAGGAQTRGPGMFGRGGGNMLTIGLNYRRATSDSANFSPFIGGSTDSSGLNFNAGYSRSFGKLISRFNFNLNRSHINRHNLYQGTRDVEGELGMAGVSTDPFDWGAPTLALTNYSSLSDVVPSQRDDSTYTGSASFSYLRGKHNLRWGGGYSRILTELRANTNPRGAFIFTGLATANTFGGTPAPGTGYDLADFLLGDAQQTSIQYSVNSYAFAGNSYNLFVQDDWRVRPNLTLNLGLRYEYTSPLSESSGRIVNLDVAPGFTAVAPVEPGQAGPFTGIFPQTLVEPDRNNFAPRIGVAWKIGKSTVIRSGYSVQYNNAQYAQMVQQLAFQPPFSFTQTNIAPTPGSLTLTDGFPPPTATVTNNYAVDKNYRLGYVQIWNANVQRELPGGLQLDVDYTGTKGTHLDLLTAPNRGPAGLLIPGVQAFLFETSAANSIVHAGTVRLRRRLRNGVSFGLNYTYSKAIDDASSIGGVGTPVVAQDPLDIAAERGLSSFDQRHRFTASYIWELPFGTDKTWLRNGGVAATLLGDWTLSGGATVGSGLPWTVRVLGNFGDVARGTNGTLRADYLGGPLGVNDPTVLEWFNTAAFAVPAPGTFGDSTRNMLTGPGTIAFDMSLGKTFAMKEGKTFDFRITANNVFNHPNDTTIDTIVNSPTFGQVIGIGSMRKAQLQARFNF